MLQYHKSYSYCHENDDLTKPKNNHQKLDLLPFHLDEDDYYTNCSTSYNMLNKMYENLQYFTREGKKILNQKNNINKQSAKLESQNIKNKTQVKRSLIHKNSNIQFKTKTEKYIQNESIGLQPKEILASELFDSPVQKQKRRFNLNIQKLSQKLDTCSSTTSKSKKYSKDRVSQEKTPETSRYFIKDGQFTIQSIMMKRQSKNQILKSMIENSKQERKLPRLLL